MSAIALKRGAKPPRRPPVTARRPASATIALPLSAAALRRNIAVAVAVLVVVAVALIATLAGVPQRLWAEIVRHTAVAGFEIKHVEISGIHEISRLKIIETALPDSGNAMLATDLAAIRQRLIDLPWVADASVGRRLPDMLVIDIVERRPVALWQYRGRFVAIDMTGKPLAARHLERFRALPVVVGAGANQRVREVLALTAAAPTLSSQVDAAILVGNRRWNLRFKSGETLALPDTPAAAAAAFKRFARLEASLADDRKLLGGRFERFDMRLPGQITVGGPAVQQALEAAAKAAKAAPKPTTI